jgi:hypothetical protein
MYNVHMAKSRANLSIDSDVWSRALECRRKYGVNLSFICEQALKTTIEQFEAMEAIILQSAQSGLSEEELKTQISLYISQTFSTFKQQLQEEQDRAETELLD